MENIKRIISKNYQWNINSIEKTFGGWSADAYIAKTDTSEYFVKVYDKQRSSVWPWIARIDHYMPVTLWLYGNTPLRNRMAVPLPTACGEYKAETRDMILLVYPMLKGITLGEIPLNSKQIRQLALILAELHSYGNEIPIATDAIRENYTLPFLQGLTALLPAMDKPMKLQNTLRAYESELKRGMKILEVLAKRLQANNSPDVLCHTDIHGWNLMWTDKMILIDWEGLHLAPAEADLFTFTDGFFFDYAGEQFMSTYQSLRKNYVENETAMQFYRLRRRMEDIAEFSKSILTDSLSQKDMDDALRGLERECGALAEMLSNSQL